MRKIGIIGLGMASAPHARSLQDLKERVQVKAAFSPSAQRRKAFAETYGFALADSADAIFSDASIDAVLLLTPPNTHLDLVRRAALAGKHVLLEKPLEISLKRAEDLVAVAENAGVKLGVVLQHRFRPISTALAGLIREGRLGDIVSASARLYNWRPQSYYDQPGRGTRARDGGGVLLTQAIHTLDLMISLAGLPVEVTGYAATSPVHRMETEDLAFAATRFEDGGIGAISATTSAYPGIPDAVDIIGTKGMARIEGAKMIAHFHDGTEEIVNDGALGGGAGADPMAFPHHHHRAVIEDFLDAIEGDRDPAVTGREALKVHRLIAAILRSSETGERAEV
ncbi:Gfo/Idh/MocA family oxidoreductase [Mesorhizobium sp. YM1C-6-2]|uniref:Gfo/Idh/MocA family protein n=1 Tax=Mesorhizobium sp. YM1C-6-2 TaxID=1827501 RepID=UPI000EF18527|nr:Gfo/Idh/MocA family oxidoreductase [Mesorhizobium sp. YM1C-6-2]RLP25980.1 gfo/Idh/MocA family oxidoreductase [Mesorhizobium sp. YM1C-6-2]